MAKVYTWRFHVRSYELDERGRVKLTAYQNYLEEAATQASASNGYDWAWYRRNRRVWVARTITIRYYAPAVYFDELELRTWVSDYRRVQSNREYDLRRVRDGAQVLRARTNWVYIDAETLRPQRLPDDFMEAFAPTGMLEPLDTDVYPGAPAGSNGGGLPGAPRVFGTGRRAQCYELDSAAHVNNAVYAGWCEQAIIDALSAAGWSAARFDSEDVALQPLSRQIEYLVSAHAGDELVLNTWLEVARGDRAAWRTEIRGASSGQLIAVDRAVKACTRADGSTSREVPQALLDAMRMSPDPAGERADRNAPE